MRLYTGEPLFSSFSLIIKYTVGEWLQLRRLRHYYVRVQNLTLSQRARDFRRTNVYIMYKYEYQKSANDAIDNALSFIHRRLASTHTPNLTHCYRLPISHRAIYSDSQIDFSPVPESRKCRKLDSRSKHVYLQSYADHGDPMIIVIIS